jgi:hypothetical protein
MMGTLSGGCSSVGRASACHAEGRGFEPLHPLHRKGPQRRAFSLSRPTRWGLKTSPMVTREVTGAP